MMAYRDSFSDLSEFLAAVVRAGIDGAGHADPRLEFSAAATGANESVPSEGGFLVPDTMAADLWQRVYDTGRILSRCERQPVTIGNKLSIPAIDETSRANGSRLGGARMHWVEEGEAPSGSKPKFGSISLQPRKLLGFAYATEELLADASALAAWLERVFALEAAFEIEDSIISGTGVGRPLGILNSGALITVDPENSESPSGIETNDLINMASRLWGPSHRNAAWLIGNDVFKVVANLTFSGGTPLMTTGADGVRRILSMPVELSEYPAALGSVGDIVLGDFGSYLVGEIAPEVISSLHVRFVESEGLFRFRYRVDGQSAWRTPVTPKNSAVTQSPFVTLGAR